MPSILLTGPAAEPITLADAKAFLRVEVSDDDTLIGSLITAARVHVENATRRALITQTWRIVLDCWPGEGCIDVIPSPARSVTAARVYDSSGTTHTIDTQAFVLDKSSSLIAVAPWSMALPGRAVAGIEIDVVCGYGDTGTDVPEALRQAMHLLIAHWYENRGVVADQQAVAPLPQSVVALIAPYRVLSL